MIRAIIRLSKASILFAIPLSLGIGLLVGELWVLKWLYGFLGGAPDKEASTAGLVVMLAGMGMTIGTIGAFVQLVGDEGCEAYQELIVHALRGTQQTGKDWWKI